MRTLALQRGRLHVLLTRKDIMRKQRKRVFKLIKKDIFEVNDSEISQVSLCSIENVWEMFYCQFKHCARRAANQRGYVTLHFLSDVSQTYLLDLLSLYVS